MICRDKERTLYNYRKNKLAAYRGQRVYPFNQFFPQQSPIKTTVSLMALSSIIAYMLNKSSVAGFNTANIGDGHLRKENNSAFNIINCY